MADHKTVELLDLISKIDDSAPVAVHREIFDFVRKYWDEFTDPTVIKEAICIRLKYTPQQFNLLLVNPEIVYGSETLSKNLKPGWLKDYIYYTSGHEAPEDFHVWVGITIVGACIRRKAWFDNVFYNMYPNLYTILVSPPGIGKKTTAINIGVGLLRESDPDCRIISEKVTPEALAKTLSKATEHAKESGGLKIEASAEGLLVAPELTVFLGREQYNEGLILFLTRLYDCADVQEVETISRGKEKLRNVCVSMLAATTPSEIHQAIGRSSKGSGFMSRLNIIQKDASPRVVPFAVKPDPAIKEMLLNGLRRIVLETKGEFKFTPEGREWYIDYYKRHNQAKQASKRSQDNLERQPDQLIKIAMCLCACEKTDMMLDADILQRSYNLLAIAAKNVGDTLRMVDASERGKLAQRVLFTMKEHGGIIQRAVLIKQVYKYGLSGRELDMIMETLIDGSMATTFLSSKKKYYKLVNLEDPEA